MEALEACGGVVGPAGFQQKESCLSFRCLDKDNHSSGKSREGCATASKCADLETSLCLGRPDTRSRGETQVLVDAHVA